MAEYIVVCHELELPYGCAFTTIPKFPYEREELVLLSLEGFLIAGRWLPGDKSDWLKLPGLLIELTERILYQIIGLIVPLNKHPCWN
jgi:hypothetical protein